MIPGEVRLVNGMAWQHAVQFCLLAACARTSWDVGWYFPREALEFPDRIQPKLMAWLGIRSVPNMGMARRSPKSIIFEHPW